MKEQSFGTAYGSFGTDSGPSTATPVDPDFVPLRPVGRAALHSARPIAVLPATNDLEIAEARSLLGPAVQVDGGGGKIVWRHQSGAMVHHPDAALIAFTSGSTGAPSIVQLSRAHLEANTAN